jgi:hypothetical protein
MAKSRRVSVGGGTRFVRLAIDYNVPASLLSRATFWNDRPAVRGLQIALESTLPPTGEASGNTVWSMSASSG